MTAGAGTTTRRRWRVPALLLTSALIGTAITVGVAAPSANAADRNATLTITGTVSSTYPVGGNTIWVQPGSALTLDAKLAKADFPPSALGLLGNILGGVVNSLVGVQATVDLRSVQRGQVTLGPGGAPNVTTPALAKGVYPFTWSFAAISTNLLGQRVSTPLNGNQLAGLGLKLNASNQFVGYIVSDTKSPCGGAQCLSLQVPTLSVAPSAPVVGQLPTVTVPGTTVNIPVPTVPGVNGSAGGNSGSSAPAAGAPGATTPGTTTTTTTTNPYGYTAPSCTGPCDVVPRGGGSGGEAGGAYGVTLADLGDSAASDSARSATNGTAAGSGSVPGANAAAGGAGSNGSDQLAVDRAFGAGDAGGAGLTAPGTPTTLAIVAAAVLAGVSVLWFARRRLSGTA